MHEIKVTLSEDEVAVILAQYLWQEHKPIDVNGYEISEADIIDSIQRDGSGGFEFHWVIEKEVE